MRSDCSNVVALFTRPLSLLITTRYNTDVRVLLDTHQLHSLSGYRGIGVYTDLLHRHLKLIPNLEVMTENDGKPYNIIHYPFFDFFFHTLPFRKSAKTVVTIHDTIPLIFPDHYKPGIRGLFRFLQQRLSLLSVSAVVTDSDSSSRDVIKHLGLPKEKVHTTLLAGNPATEKQSTAVCKRVKVKYNLPDKFVLYVGDINYNKNLPRCIEAFSYLPKPYHLVMVGRSLTQTQIPEGQALHQAIERHGVRERVHLLTGVPKDPPEDLAALFTLASTYIQPSLYEGFGLPVLDAMQCGTPVVASYVSSLSEVGGDCAIYVNPLDAKDMALGMVKALRLTQKQRTEYMQRAMHHAHTFSWEKTAYATYEVYKKVMVT